MRPTIETSPLLPFVLDYSTSALKLVKTIRTNFHKATQDAGKLQDHRLTNSIQKKEKPTRLFNHSQIATPGQAPTQVKIRFSPTMQMGL